MIVQDKFLKMAGMPYTRLKALQSQEKFLPVFKNPFNKRSYYSDEQVDEAKEYMTNLDSGMSTAEFARRIDVSVYAVSTWIKKGILVADHVKSGDFRFTEEQVQDYLENGLEISEEEESFYNRKQIAELFGVSMSLVSVWCNSKGYLKPDHKSFSGILYYKKADVDDFYKNGVELWDTSLLQCKRMKKLTAVK